MKRFFCTICGRVKRVRRLPSNITSEYAVTPALRQGTCDKHSQAPVAVVSRAHSNKKVS